MRPAAAPRTHGIVTWGIGDFLVAWLVGLLASVVVGGFVSGGRLTPLDIAITVTVQDAGYVGWLALVSQRKGLGSLGADFGLVGRPSGGWSAAAPWFLAGVVLQVASYWPLHALQLVHGEDAKQEIVQVVERGSGGAFVLLVATVLVVAPVAEELMFRGVLLRSLLRRVGPGAAVLVSAVAFGLVHLLDFTVGSLIALPVLVLFGVVSGWLAVRSGDLGRSILFHAGFNAFTAVALITQR
ncbi:MAG: CPBP family intramembrane glutamic endopeptidase [Acidimicrobiia bacterium]